MVRLYQAVSDGLHFAYLDKAMGVPVYGDAVSTRRDSVVELVEQEASQGDLRCHTVRDEDAVQHYNTANHRPCNVRSKMPKEIAAGAS
jgi:hypothetical protein